MKYKERNKQVLSGEIVVHTKDVYVTHTYDCARCQMYSVVFK